jgi:hypothetical protein
MTLLIVSGAAVVGLGVWAMIRGLRRERPDATNNWRNEDYMSREADGTWTEGSTYSKSQSPDSTGIGL